jgi:hypothetical protein
MSMKSMTTPGLLFLVHDFDEVDIVIPKASCAPALPGYRISLLVLVTQGVFPRSWVIVSRARRMRLCDWEPARDLL